MMRVKLFGLPLALALLSVAAARAGAQTPAPMPAPTPAQAAPAQAAPAAKADEKLPAADEVFAKYVEARGGEAALGKFKSRVERGSIEVSPMGAKGTFESSQKSPDKVVTTINIAGLGMIQRGYDGAAGWSKDPFTGLRDVQGAELSAMRRAALLNPAGLSKAYKAMKVTGRAKVGERDAYVVEGAHEGATPDKFYFDTQTGLLLRMDAVVDSPQGRVPSESTFEDYREVDGVLMPHTTRVIQGPVTLIVRVEEIKHDAPLEDKIFAKPAS